MSAQQEDEDLETRRRLAAIIDRHRGLAERIFVELVSNIDKDNIIESDANEKVLISIAAERAWDFAIAFEEHVTERFT